MVADGQHILQQRKECHVRFDASVGIHSQSLGHRHVGNPATASVAHTLGRNKPGQNEIRAAAERMKNKDWEKLF